MNIKLTKDKMEKPLRFMEPDCYDMLQKEMERYHLHPYDIKADAVWENENLRITLRYGDGMEQCRVDTFSRMMVEKVDENLSVFFQQAVEECKKVLISDYFKLMKP